MKTNNDVEFWQGTICLPSLISSVFSVKGIPTPVRRVGSGSGLQYRNRRLWLHHPVTRHYLKRLTFSLLACNMGKMNGAKRTVLLQGLRQTTWRMRHTA